VSEARLPSLKSISRMIEEAFCSKISTIDKGECIKLMEKKRMKKITKEELLKALGLSEQDVDRLLDQAVSEVERSL